MALIDRDPLLLLRQCIASGSAIMPSTESGQEAPLCSATHLLITSPERTSLPIGMPTRFESNGTPVDLRSIYFAWLNREVAIPDYNTAATKLNEELGGAAVHKFAFVERLDLITWLEGAGDESDYIKPLIGEAARVAAVAATATEMAAKALPMAGAAAAGRVTTDPRLLQIYQGERKTGDRNTALRGLKPTDFSHVRKLAALFMSKKPSAPSSAAAPTASSNASHPSVRLAHPLTQKPARRPDPIILLSPSASSLLRLSNAKSFLESAQYAPPDNNSTLNLLHVSRLLKDIDPNRPLKFVLVESLEQFKPDYWNRVVAVFTTGQAWQFKNYRWTDPSELFKHVLGIYLGWKGDVPPVSVRAYGHRVLTCQVDKGEGGRWRDREVVEGMWKQIEANMRARGWRKDAAPREI